MVFAVPLGLSSFTGCSSTQLAPGGAYTDTTLYAVDQTIVTSKAVVDTFLSWEKSNRPALVKYPQITAYANSLRDQYEGWNTSALALRDAYKANPTSDGLSKLNAALAILRSALTEATKYLAQPTPST